jgi:regulator of telomere elongation helicase 1
MPLLVIRDVPIDFPFKPYECQEVYMERVLQCLDERNNALLESPTGTGKVSPWVVNPR